MKSLIFLVIFLISFLAWGQPRRDPFRTGLPVPEEEEDLEEVDLWPEEPVVEKVELPEPIAVQGILWGTDRPLAIINDKVYASGDTLEDLDVTLVEVRRDVVLISYRGKIFRRGTKGK